jgi:hypothetical protein
MKPDSCFAVVAVGLFLSALTGCSADIDGDPNAGAESQSDAIRDANGNEVVTALVDTYLKVSTADSSTLAAADRCFVRKGTKVTLKMPKGSGAHVQGALASAHGCGGKFGGGATVFVYRTDFSGWSSLPTPPSSNPIAVPYFNQYDDARVNPSGSCGNTSTAMLLRFYGIATTPDSVRSKYDGGGDCGGGFKPWQCPEGLSRIQTAEGLKSRYTRVGNRAQIKRQIDAGRPVIIHGNFTSVGHIMVIVGYDDAKKEWITNDPAGRWCGAAFGGYSSCGGDRVSGASRRYSYSAFSNSVLGADGDIWMSTASKSAFTL